MRILITNDDGYSARGIAILKQTIEEMGAEVTVVAPINDMSGVSHSITLSQPMTTRQIGDRHFALNGTPADCVAFAFSELYDDDNPPDAVISGVNHGSNISDEMICSGTVAGARAGAFRGVLGIALSQVFRGKKLSEMDATPISPSIVRTVLETILSRKWSPSIFFNVNFPDYATDGAPRQRDGHTVIACLHEIIAREARLECRQSPRGTEYYWYGFERDYLSISERDKSMISDSMLMQDYVTDLEAVNSGAISITALPVYPTAVMDLPSLNELASIR